MIIGDLKFHVNDTSDNVVAHKFCSILDCCGSIRHVNRATQELVVSSSITVGVTLVFVGIKASSSPIVWLYRLSLIWTRPTAYNERSHTESIVS